MQAQDFPIDDSAYVVTFPCFILRNTSGAGFVCSDLADGSGIAVALLTDTDALDSYRKEMGLPDRAAHRFNTAAELLEVMENIPPTVTHVAPDPLGIGLSRGHRVLEINRFRERLRAKMG
jgi:hypothetical protein